MTRFIRPVPFGSLALLAFGCVLATTGCVHSVESDVSVTPAPQEDTTYSDVLGRYTHNRTVFKDFETRYEVTATYLSPEFRGAFQKRLERVFRHSQGEFEEAGGKIGFFVSIHSPMDDRTDLSNPHHWSLLLASTAGDLKPVVVKKLTDKERWRAFFPAVAEWTTEYLVVFDAPAVDPQSPALVEKTTISVTFANADAQVNLTW